MESVTTQSTQVQLRVNAFVRSVYNWMGVGLALTGLIAFYVANSPGLLRYVYANRMIFFGLLIAELAIVFVLSARINKMRASTATGLFLLYSALNGLTMSFVFIVYTSSSIASTFFVCAATFVACSVFGWTTKRDLTSLGGFLMMGLIGIIIASVVNLFIGSSAFGMIISYVGVLVFVGLTAYDTQYIKNMALSQPEGLEAGVLRRGAIIGALKLYLDFINLFLMLLRIMGNRE
jgi:FtsH-binding integral membrane protein